MRLPPFPLFLPFLLFLASCAGPQVAVNRRADFSKIHRIAVTSFSGPGGEGASDLLAQDLLARGADVIERQRLDAVLNEQHLSVEGILEPSTIKRLGKILGVDALIVGTVTSYSPGQSYLVFSGGGSGSTVIGNAVTPISGSGMLYSQGPAIGAPGSEVLTSNATVGLTARMVDVETASIMWSARMNYEGFDVETAMSQVTKSFADSLVPVWPQLTPLR